MSTTGETAHPDSYRSACTDTPARRLEKLPSQLPIVASGADSAAEPAEQSQDRSDHDQDDSDRDENIHLREQKAKHHQDDTENDHDSS